MLSSIAPWCAETCISASDRESKKPHQGFAGHNLILHRGIEWSKSTLALGLPEWAGKTVSGPAVAANNGTPNCISPGVCKSPIDKLNLMEIGKTNYRDPFSICSTHTTVDNSTGATSSHVDLFNPGTSIPTGPMTGNVPALPFHLIFDALPDAIYRVTGQYLLPAGRGLCQ